MRDVKPVDRLSEAQVSVDTDDNDSRVDRQQLDADERYAHVGVDHEPLVQDHVDYVCQAARPGTLDVAAWCCTYRHDFASMLKRGLRYGSLVSRVGGRLFGRAHQTLTNDRAVPRAQRSPPVGSARLRPVARPLSSVGILRAPMRPSSSVWEPRAYPELKRERRSRRSDTRPYAS